MDYSFNLPTPNLIRFRIDLIKSVSTDDIQKEILTFFNITNLIMCQEVSSKVEKPHVHVVGYLPDTKYGASDIRKRIGRILFKNKDQSVGEHAAVSDKWTNITKHKDMAGVMTLCNVNYAQFHVYYICKDKKIIVNTLNPFLNLDGYTEILDKLPHSVKTIQAKLKHRVSNPNFLKVCIEKYKLEKLPSDRPVHMHGSRDLAMAHVLTFVQKAFYDHNHSGSEHLGKLCDDFTLVKFTQSIYNLYYFSDYTDHFDDMLMKCLR